jgi:hypothetical protein
LLLAQGIAIQALLEGGGNEEEPLVAKKDIHGIGTERRRKRGSEQF